MRDDIWFKSDVKQRQVHNPPRSVPHAGMTTEARENFVIPSDVKAKEAKLCPIETPFVLPGKYLYILKTLPKLNKIQFYFF